jgi:hypothetical protein
MKKVIFLCAAILASSAVHAENRYRSLAKDPMVCSSEYAAEFAFKTSRDGSDGSDAGQPRQGEICRPLRADQTFAVVRGDINGDGVKSITNVAYSHAYLPYLAGPIEKIAEDREPVDNTCKVGDWMPSGEVDRLVAGKDGTLKLKRFMVTTACVNGQMRSSTKPLN